jgi:hypothetical protein
MDDFSRLMMDIVVMMRMGKGMAARVGALEGCSRVEKTGRLWWRDGRGVSLSGCCSRFLRQRRRCGRWMEKDHR